MRHPLKSDSLAKLKAMGVPIETILDVGVQTCTPELLHAFPDRHHLLMEPIVEYNPAMTRIYGGAGVSYEILNVAMSDRDGEVTLKTAAVFENYGVSHARMTEEQGEGENFRRVPMRSLDSIVAEHQPKGPFLLKIDVDGAEMMVLAGARETLKNASVVMIEAGVGTFLERGQAIVSAGFEPFDIVDLCYYDGRWVQSDMVFLSKKVIGDLNLRIYQGPFDAKKWVIYGREHFRSGSRNPEGGKS